MPRIKDIQIKMTADEVQEILSIALDEDHDKAFHFICDQLAKKVEKALQQQ